MKKLLLKLNLNEFLTRTKKLIFILSALLLLITVTLFVFKGEKLSQSTAPKDQHELVQKDTDTALQGYYDSYKDPFVIQIRTTLNSYLKDPKTLSETILEGLGDGNSGLKNFSSDYYKGRFVVMDIKKALAGGEEVSILFPDKPDKVFWVWIYKTTASGYEMRGFQQNPAYTQEKIDHYIKQYTQLINDKEHSM